MTPTLNIAALTRRTGVPPDTIRKWEQRYGVLRPERTTGGQRRYTELDVARVLWLKARIEEGYRIGEAAALLGAAPIAPESPADLRDEFVAAALRSDLTALTTVVEHSLMLDPLDSAFSEVLAPALVEVGEAWGRGELTVAQEHLASGAVRGALQHLVADMRGDVRGVAVLACAPGEQHEVGLLMLATLLRADGWQVAYLGADTPFDDATELATMLDATALCFTASRKETLEPLRKLIDAARLPPTLRVLVGGRAVEDADVRDAVAELRA